MKPLRLHVSGYGRFPECELELPAGTVALVGGNGAGKSRLLNAVELALYARGSADLAPWLSPWTDRLVVELEFEHAGETYRARQGYRVGASGRGSATVDLEQLFHGSDGTSGWTPLPRENADATRALIAETVGLSRRAFRASSFLAQNDAGAFTEASPADRRAVLGEVCDPRGTWQQLASLARDRAKLIETDVAASRARASVAEETAALLPGLRKASAELERQELTARAELADAELFLQLAQDAMAANTVAAERVKTARVKAETADYAVVYAEDALQKARLAANNLPPAREHLAQLRTRSERVPELEQRLDEQRKQVAEAQAVRERKLAANTRAAELTDAVKRVKGDYDALQARADSLAQQLAHLEASGDGTERCAVCEQLLGAEARAAAIQNLTRAARAAAEEAAAKRTDGETAAQAARDAIAAAAAITLPEPVAVEDVEEPLRQAREAAAGIPQAEHNVTELERRADEIPDLEVGVTEAAADLRAAEAALAEASAGVTDQAALEHAAAGAKQTVTAARRAVDVAAIEVARTSERVKVAEQAEHELAEIRSRTGQAQTQLDLLRLAERAYGRDGIPVLLTENVIPLIETEANRILQQMPTADGVTFTVELHTQRAQKGDASKTTETLDILVNDPDTTRAYESFSGGEQARLNIALRVALARLLAGRRGADSRLLAIDEIPYLDVLGQGQLVDVIQGVAGDFDTCVVVSHHEILRDSFDTVVEVVKTDGVSGIAGTREPEPERVAA